MRDFDRWVSCLLLGLSLLPALLGQEPAAGSPHTRAAALTAKAAFFVDPAWLADAGLRRAIDGYCARVRSSCGYELLVTAVPPTERALDVRVRLQGLHKEHGIRGVLLAGEFALPTFRNECGDENALHAYYGDLDGRFAADAAGRYVRYEPWGTGKDVMELWVALLRPYRFAAKDGRSIAELVAWFDRCVVEDERRPVGATLVATKDWRNQQPLCDAMRGTFGDVMTFGVAGARGSSPESGGKEFRQALARQGELFVVFAHSGATSHHLDGDGVLAVPRRDGDPRHLSIEAQPVQSRALVLWGCHALDLRGKELSGRPFLADSYLLAAGSRAEVVLGTSRSIGIEAMERLVEGMRGKLLCEAWLDYLNLVYSEQFLSTWFRDPAVYARERSRFDWGYVVYGNPFVRFAAPTSPR